MPMKRELLSLSVCAVELKMDRKRNLCIVWNKKIQQTTKAKVSVAGLKWEPEKGNIFNTKVHNT